MEKQRILEVVLKRTREVIADLAKASTVEALVELIYHEYLAEVSV